MIDAEIAWHVDLVGLINTPVSWTTTLNFSSGSVIPSGGMFVKVFLSRFEDLQEFGLQNEHPFAEARIFEVTSGGITQQVRRNVYTWFQSGVSRVVVGGTAKNAEATVVYSAQHWT